MIRRTARAQDGEARVDDPDLRGAAEVAMRRVRLFALVSLLGLLSTGLPLPWQLGAPVLAVVAVVLGVRALSAARRAKLRGLVVVAVSAGIGFSVMIVVVFTSVVALWPLQYELQECERRALTVSARHACEASFEQGVAERIERLLGTTD